MRLVSSWATVHKIINIMFKWRCFRKREKKREHEDGLCSCRMLLIYFVSRLKGAYSANRPSFLRYCPSFLLLVCLSSTLPGICVFERKQVDYCLKRPLGTISVVLHASFINTKLFRNNIDTPDTIHPSGRLYTVYLFEIWVVFVYT